MINRETKPWPRRAPTLFKRLDEMERWSRSGFCVTDQGADLPNELTGTSMNDRSNHRIVSGGPASATVSALTGLPEPRLSWNPGALIGPMSATIRLPGPSTRLTSRMLVNARRCRRPGSRSVRRVRSDAHPFGR